METLTVSVLDNPFEEGDVAMSHISIIGKAGSGKTELIKQIIGSLLKSGKKVLWFNSYGKTKNDLTKQWNGYQITHKEDVKKDILLSHKLIFIDTEDIDFEKLKNLLIEDETEWVLVQDNVDEMINNYEQNEYDTQKLEFLYFVSEFGRVFNVYTFIAGQDWKALSKVLPSKKIVSNSKNLLLLNQSYSSMKYLKKQKVLSEEQLEKVANLPKYKAFYLRR